MHEPNEPNLSSARASLLHAAGYRGRRDGLIENSRRPDDGAETQVQRRRLEKRWPLHLVVCASVISAGIGSALTFWVLTPNDGAKLRSSSVHQPLASPVSPSTSGSGYVIPLREATVSSDEIGRIVDIRVRPGEYVRKGQILALLDNSLQRVELDKAQENYAVATAQYREAVTSLASTTANYDRIKALAEKGFASRASVDDVLGQRANLSARIDTGLVQMRLSKNGVYQAQEMLAHRVITAPFDGTISQIYAQIGETVSPSSAGSSYTRTGICTLIDKSAMFASVDLDEATLDTVSRTSRIVLLVPALNKKFNGTLEQGAYEIDRVKGTGLVRIRILNPTNDLLPNMTVQAEIN